MVSATEAFVCGKDGFFAKTINAGTTWTTQNTAVPDDFEALHFPSAGTGYLAYKDGKVKKTDGNGTFTSVYAATSKDLKGVWFVSNTRGWVVGKEGRILLTNDGGLSWSSHNIAAITSELTDVTFPSPNVGYIVGEDGKILKLSNGNVASVTENELTFSLFPNPALDFITIQTNTANPLITITDLSGKIVIERSSKHFSISELQAGTYFIQVFAAGMTSTQQFIKQ
ncbi:Ycf48-like protein [compost metagenome]